MDGLKRLCLLVFTIVDIVIFGCLTKANEQNKALEKGREDINQTFKQGDDFYEWSVWSPCSRSCGIGVKFRGQLCLRKNKALCVEKPIIYETCNTQACPPGGKSFRDLQCGIYNDRNIFINGQKAKWVSYVRGDNQCLLFCYPQGGELFYYFGKAKDGTQCSKEPRGVCIRGRCKPVGCDNVLESGVYLDKCRVCGGNSTTCELVRGRRERSPNHFEKVSGYAEVMVIPKGSTSVFLSDETWNYLAIKRKNGGYVFNGDRIASWSGLYKIGDVDVQYTKFSNNVKETIQIPGPTEEDIYVMCLLITGKLNISFEYWIPIKDAKVLQEAAEVKAYLQGNRLDLLIEWGRWTACSATCGGGIKVRARKQGNGDVSSFLGGETDVQRCGDVPCDDMMSEWSEWGPWDDCSASCRGGARMRFRYCKTPNQSTDSSSCLGDRYAVELCNAQECPTEGKMANTSDIIDVETTSLLQETPAVNSTGTNYEIYPSSSITPKDNFSYSHKIARTAPFSTSFFIIVSQSTPSSLMGGASLTDYTLTSTEIFHFPANSILVSEIKASKTTHESYFSVTEQVIPDSADHDQNATPFLSSDVRKLSTSGLNKNLVSTARGHTSARTPLPPSNKLSTTEANVLAVRPSFSKWLSLPTHLTAVVSYMTTNAHSVVLGSLERSQAITFGTSIFPLFVTHSIIPRPREKFSSSSMLNESAKTKNSSSNRKAFEVKSMSERPTIQESNFVSLSVKRATFHYPSFFRDSLSTTGNTNMAASEANLVTNAVVTTPVSIQEKMVSPSGSLLSNVEQSRTLKPQTRVSIFDINSRHPLLSTDSFSRKFKATESSKHLGNISSKLIMTRSARTPPSTTVLKSVEGPSGQVGFAPPSPYETQSFLFNVRTRSFLPPMDKTGPQTSFSNGTMLFFEPNDARSGRVLLKTASESSGLSSSLNASGHNITPQPFSSTKQEVHDTRNTAELTVEGEGWWRGTIQLLSEINALTKYFHASKRQDTNSKSTNIILEEISAVKSVRPTKTTILPEIMKLINVWPPTPSIGLSTSERLKSSTGYTHGRLSRSVFPTIVLGLPREALTKRTYTFERETSSRPSPSFELLPTLTKIPTPVDEAKLLLPSPSVNLSSTTTDDTGFTIIPLSPSSYFSPFTKSQHSLERSEDIESGDISISLSKEESPSSIRTKDTSITLSKNPPSTLPLAYPSSAIEEGRLLQSTISTSVLRNQPVLSSPYRQFNSTTREVRTTMQFKGISSFKVRVGTSLSSRTTLAPKEEDSITNKDSDYLRNSEIKQNLVSNETDSFNSSLFRERVPSSITESTQVMKGKDTLKIESLTRSSSSQNLLFSWYKALTGTIKDDFKATQIDSFMRPLPRKAIISSTKMQLSSTQYISRQIIPTPVSSQSRQGTSATTSLQSTGQRFTVGISLSLRIEPSATLSSIISVPIEDSVLRESPTGSLPVELFSGSPSMPSSKISVTDESVINKMLSSPISFTQQSEQPATSSEQYILSSMRMQYTWPLTRDMMSSSQSLLIHTSESQISNLAPHVSIKSPPMNNGTRTSPDASILQSTLPLVNLALRVSTKRLKTFHHKLTNFPMETSAKESESVASSLSISNIPISASKNSTLEATVWFSSSISSAIHFNLPMLPKMSSKQKPTQSSFSGPSSVESIRPSSYSAINKEALPRHKEYVTISSVRPRTPPVTEGVFICSVLPLKSMSTRKPKQLSTSASFSNLTLIPNELSPSHRSHPSSLSSQRHPLSSNSIKYVRSLSLPSQRELSPNLFSPNKTTREREKTVITPTVSTEFLSSEHSPVSYTLKDVSPGFSSVKRSEAIAESLDFSLASESSQSSLDLKFPPIQESSNSDFESTPASLSRLPKIPMNTNSSSSANEYVTSSSSLTKRMQISVSRNLNSSTNADHVKPSVLDKKTPPWPPWQAITPTFTQFSSIEVEKVTMSYMPPFMTSLLKLTPSSMYAQLTLTREQSNSTGKDCLRRLMSSQPTQFLTSSGVRPAGKMITSVSQKHKIITTFEYFNSRPADESSTNNVNSIASSSAGVSFSLAVPLIFSSDETTNTWESRQWKTASQRLITMKVTYLTSAAIGEDTVSKNVVSLTSHPILSSMSPQFRLGALQRTISLEAPVNPTSKKITPSLTSLPIEGNFASLMINLTTTSSLKTIASSTYLKTILSSKKAKITAIISPEGSLMSKDDERFTTERSSIRNPSVLYMENFTSKSLVSFSRSLDSTIVNQLFTASLIQQISTRKTSKHELMLKTSSSSLWFTNGMPSLSSLAKVVVASSPILEKNSRLVAHSVKPTTMNEAAVSASTIRHQEKHRCDPCVNRIKLTRAYCISDFVVHVRILTEGINELSLDTNYRISIINIFKMKSSSATFRSVWILNNLCSCPLLHPGKQYLLTGKMTRVGGSTKIIAEVSQESYIEEWTKSMLTRMEEMKSKRCSLIRTTYMTTSARTKPESTSGPTKRPALFTSGRTTKCLPCDLDQRLREKYCGSDYAIIVRVRPEEIVNGNHTLYLVNVKKVFKKNQRMKKKLDVRFNNKTCDCKPKLSFKRAYLVIGNHNVTIRKMASLELDRQSFLAEWDETLEKEMNQVADSCFRNSIVVTPRLANSLQIMTVIKTSATFQISAPTGKYATISSQAAASPHVTVTHTTKLSVTASTAGNRCDPCVNRMKRARAYCISDFVVHVRILSEGINELSLNTNYRVRFIHMFKMNSSLRTFRSVWILSNLCRCPLLLPGKQYLLMGKMTRMSGPTNVIAEVSRESYVEEWNGSLLRRVQGLRKRCPLIKTTQTTTLVRTEPKVITEKCRMCRKSKKRNKSYCESDFVIRARILQSTFDNRTQERRYLVRVITVFRNLLDLKTREEIFVQDDYCQCPRLFLQKQYVIMGTAEQISVSEFRLLIPQRPFVKIWQTNMEARLLSIGDICHD